MIDSEYGTTASSSSSWTFNGDESGLSLLYITNGWRGSRPTAHSLKHDLCLSAGKMPNVPAALNPIKSYHPMCVLLATSCDGNNTWDYDLAGFRVESRSFGVLRTIIGLFSPKCR